MISYTFREIDNGNGGTSPFVPIKNAKDAKAQVIGEAIAAITAAHDGRLKPEDVWKAAKAPRHVLHKHFEWDVQVAAEAHWTDQARALIRCIRIVDQNHDEPTYAYLSITDKGGTAYRTTGEIFDNARMQSQVLDNLIRDLEGWEKRARSIRGVYDILHRAREEIEQQRLNMSTENPKVRPRGGKKPNDNPKHPH